MSRAGALAAAAVGLWLALSLTLVRTANAARQDVRWRLERPAAHSRLGSTSTPTTSGFHRVMSCKEIQFDYGLDSEAGYDSLRLLVDGVVVWSVSGGPRLGHERRYVTSGAHDFAFEYVKDTSVDSGADTAWISAVTCVEPAGTATSYYFNYATVMSAWSPYGYGGGWTAVPFPPALSLARPLSQAFTVYQPGVSVSSIGRCFSWPSTAGPKAVRFNYYVDSELGYDFLRVSIDGVVVWSESGREKSGHKTIILGSGFHCIKFAYEKDTSVDAGADTARIDNVQFAEQHQAAESDWFDDYRQTGVQPTGWFCSSGEACWSMQPATPPRVIKEPATLTSAFVVDGVRDSGLPRAARLVGTGNGGAPMQAHLGTDVGGGRFGLAVGLPLYGAPGSVATGQVVVSVDGNHDLTVGGGGCGLVPGLPGAEDRRFVATYTALLADGAATVAVQSSRGSCASGVPWVNVLSGEDWSVGASATVTRDVATADPPFFLNVEFIVTPGTNFFSAGRFGIAVEHKFGQAMQFVSHFPTHQPPAIADARTWATIGLIQGGVRPTAPEWGAVYDLDP